MNFKNEADSLSFCIYDHSNPEYAGISSSVVILKTIAWKVSSFFATTALFSSITMSFLLPPACIQDLRRIASEYDEVGDQKVAQPE